jgi:RNA polymerase primary sigma factor
LANARLVARLARQFSALTSFLSYEDLLTEGLFGLVKAVEGFNPAVGAQFSTYAYMCIRKALRHALDTQADMIRLPSHGRPELMDPVLARRTHMLRSDGLVALDRRVPLDGGGTYSAADNLRSCDDVEAAALDAVTKGQLTAALAEFTPKDREIFVLYYGLDDGTPRTMREVAALVGLTATAVNNSEVKSRSRLCHPRRALASGDGPWRELAACRGRPEAVLFTSKPAVQAEAKALCASCSVQAECLGYALRTGCAVGIWGGLAPAERKALRPLPPARPAASQPASTEAA